jgi:hypothetical protein
MLVIILVFISWLYKRFIKDNCIGIVQIHVHEYEFEINILLVCLWLPEQIHNEGEMV